MIENSIEGDVSSIDQRGSKIIPLRDMAVGIPHSASYETSFGTAVVISEEDASRIGIKGGVLPRAFFTDKAADPAHP